MSNIELLNPALQAPKMPQDASQSAKGSTKANDAAAADKTKAGTTASTTDLTAAASSFQKALKTVTDNLGGAIALQWATARSVSLDEDFPRPLVIGYLGFDFPVNEDGSLGTPIATQHQLEGTSGPGKITGQSITSMEYSQTARELRSRIERWLKQDRATNVPKLTAWLKDQGIAIPVGMWVRSDRALPSRLARVIKDLGIPE